MQIDKNRRIRTINRVWRKNNRVTETCFTLLFANPYHLVQQYFQSKTLGTTLVKGQVKWESIVACTRPLTDTNVRALSRKVKCGCSIQRIRTNMNNLTALKRATIGC